MTTFFRKTNVLLSDCACCIHENSVENTPFQKPLLEWRILITLDDWLLCKGKDGDFRQR